MNFKILLFFNLLKSNTGLYNLIRYFYLPILTLVIFTGCNESSTDNDQCRVIINFKNASGKTFYFKELKINEVIIIDSFKVKKADKPIVFNLTVPEPGIFVITDNRDNFIPLVLKNGSTIGITAKADELQKSYLVEGSDESTILYNYNVFTNKHFDRINDLNMYLLRNQQRNDFSKVRDSIYNLYDSVFKAQQQSVISLIDSFPGSLAVLFIINQRFGRMLPITEDEHLHYFKLIDSAIMVEYPKNLHTLDHHQRVKNYIDQLEEKKLAAENTSPGKLAPEIRLPDPEGNIQSLFSLHGKVVLVYFWASWNGSSRQFNKELLKLYATFSDRGFEIFGVSFDNNQEMWENAIHVDQITWTQVSDLAYPSSPIQKLYNVNEIPSSFLLNREGIIVAKNLKENMLRSEINELLN